MSLSSLTAPASQTFQTALVGFAEPDWKGDVDFDGLPGAIDPERLLSDLAQDIEAGSRLGWLSAYEARRAGFDLQSIRCQAKLGSQRGGDVEVGAELRAILSRIDRLAGCLRSARRRGWQRF